MKKKKSQKVRIVIGILSILLLSSVIYIVHDLSDNDSPDTVIIYQRENHDFYIPMSPDFRINYDGLTPDQIKNIGDVLGEFDPKYFAIQKNITFTSNITKWCSDCIGQNQNNGENIIIQYYDDKDFLFDLTCHELVHTFISQIPLDLEEEIVEDAEAGKLCLGRTMEVEVYG